MKENLTQIYVTHNAKSKNYDDFFNAMERDNFMSPAEAVEFGIIDSVPELQVPKPRPNFDEN